MHVFIYFATNLAFCIFFLIYIKDALETLHSRVFLENDALDTPVPLHALETLVLIPYYENQTHKDQEHEKTKRENCS
jgi:hypothetical protein